MPKKTKAVKKTDRNKAWLKKSQSASYKVETMEVNRTILIVGEGQTEKLYFGSFPVLALTVQAIDLGGQSKLKLVEATEDIAKEKDFDEIWCVFDMDVKHGEKEFADFDNAIKSGRTKGYKIAYSNDCFELWFYLHYHYVDQKKHRTFYYHELGKLWSFNYEKEGKRYKFCEAIYAILESDENASQKDAISRAKKLLEDQNELLYHDQNPITLVFKLVEFLNDNCRR